MNIAVQLAKAAVSRLPDNSPFSSATPGAKPPAAPKPAAGPAAPAAGQLKPLRPVSPPPPPPAAPVAAAPPPAPPPPPVPVPQPAAASQSPNLTPFFDALTGQSPTPPVAPGSGQNPLMSLLAPQIMRHAAPAVGAVGGAPLLMMLWDLIGGSGGRHLKTIFGGPRTPPPAPQAAAPVAAPPESPEPLPVAPPPRSVEAPPQSPPAAPPQPAVPAVPPPPAPQAYAGPPPGHPQFEDARATLARADGVTPDQITDADVMANLQAVPAGQSSTAAVPVDQNWAQRFRHWANQKTTTGLNLPVVGDAGHLAAGIAGFEGLRRGAGLLAGKTPGFLPATFALDGLDVAGANPLSDRFGNGVMGVDEARTRGAALANTQSPFMRALQSGVSPVSTLYQYGAMTPATGEDLGTAAVAPHDTIAAERRHGMPVGLNPTGGDKYTRVRNPDGTSRWASPLELASRVTRDAVGDGHWTDMVPNALTPFRFVGPAADAATEGALNMNDAMARARANPDAGPSAASVLNGVVDAADSPAGRLATFASPAAGLGSAAARWLRR